MFTFAAVMVIGCVISDKPLREFSSACWSREIVQGKPVLYVGLQRAADSIPGFDVSVMEYPGDVWWTYRKNENRKEYIRRTTLFKEVMVRRAVEDVSYEYIDYPCYSEGRRKSLMSYLISADPKICFVTRGSSFIFIHSPKYRKVWGLSLSLLDYIGENVSNFLVRLRSNPHNEFVVTAEFMTPDLRRIVGDDTHFIPILYGLIGGRDAKCD